MLVRRHFVLGRRDGDGRGSWSMNQFIHPVPNVIGSSPNMGGKTSIVAAP